MRLYLLQPRVLQNDGLAALDAPTKPGLFKTDADWRDVEHALAEHKIAAVDPVRRELIPVLYRSLRIDPHTGNYAGPPVFFDSGAIRPPELPMGGLPIAETIASYLAGAPVPVAPIAGTISIRAFRETPLLWRRTIPGPARELRGRHERDLLRAWLSQQTAPLSQTRLVAWWRAERSAQWRAMAVRQFMTDLEHGGIVAWSSSGEAVPTTFWEGDVWLEVARGILYSANGAPLAHELRVYLPDEKPLAVAERESLMAQFGNERAMVRATISANRSALLELSFRSDQVAFLRERLPSAELETIRSTLARELPGRYERRRGTGITAQRKTELAARVARRQAATVG